MSEVADLFTVVDTETTGFDPENDAIVEIAAVDVENNVVSEFIRESLIFPAMLIPPEASAVHHITSEMVRQSPRSREVIPDILLPDRTPRPVYVAHNAKFDSAFLKPYVGNAQWICTYKCALRIWPDAPAHNNQTLRYFLKLPVNSSVVQVPHRAGADAHVTAHLLVALLQKAALTQLLEWSNEPALLPKCPIGKEWRGKPWAQVEYGFLSWILGNVDDRDIVWNAKREMSRRAEAQRAERAAEKQKKADATKENREAYLALAKSAIPIAGNVADLNKWFTDEKESRLKNGVVKGTDEYDEVVRLCTEHKTKLLAQQPTEVAAA